MKPLFKQDFEKKQTTANERARTCFDNAKTKIKVILEVLASSLFLNIDKHAFSTVICFTISVFY